MAILATVETDHGETRELYVRLNSIEASNHGVKSTAKFRGFLSESAFRSGKKFIFEKDIDFQVDVSRPIWVQAYEAFKKKIEGDEVADA